MKSLAEIKTIAVIGAGTMGSGIAQVAAQGGYKTILFDVNDAALQKGKAGIEKNLSIAVEKNKLTAAAKTETLSRIIFTSTFSDLVAQVFIEAILENLEVKQTLFQKLAQQNAADVLLASNTSTIPITQIADGISNPERVVGMHFFNPAHVMKLVEIISGKKTSDHNAQFVFQLAQQWGKQPVMAKDRPGFIVNRIGKMYHTEPLYLLEKNMASKETIDALMEASGFKMGPFKLIDLIGVDANLNVTKSLYALMQQEQFKPSALQQRLVDEGKLGRKNGEGFYKY